MSVCDKIRGGLDMTCINYQRRYYQQAVIVNRADVANFRIVTSYSDIEGEYFCRNRVYFDLLEGKTGFRFKMGENATSISGSAAKKEVENIPQYDHNVNLVILGVDEQAKCLLNQLDKGDYFAALQFYDGTIEIFGFEFGLTTSNYDYNPTNTGGGAVLKLTSLNESPEDELPFIYKNQTGTEVTDFDNNFANNDFDPNGDFNDDFNNDFNNG